MSEEYDYKKLGFKAGLEIHQQLDTKKLFCDCPSLLRTESPDFMFDRKLHAVAGESGEIDVSAKFESEKKNEFVYEGHYENSCLVELDEEPPHDINQEALKIALQIALLLNCQILKFIQVMRKTVVDGSNVSGFQRTVLIARNGYVETSYGKVKIDSVALEEDAARIVEKRGDQVVYRIDRLGIPLVEIATAPDIKNPEQCRETALKIGEILRSCRVKRGIGTIRQDVNMSISRGARVEIKGMQEPKLMVMALNKEIKRQISLIEKKEKVLKEVRKVLPNAETEFLRPLPGAARMYPETDLEILKISRNFVNEIKRNLPKLKSELHIELKETGLNDELINLVLKNNKIEDLKEFVQIYNDPSLVAKMLVLYPREIASKNEISLEKVESILNEDVIAEILEALSKKKINSNQVKEVLERVVKGERVIKALEFDKVDLSKIEETVFKVVKEKPGLSEKAYMGLIMKEFKGKVNGKEVMEIIRKYIG